MTNLEKQRKKLQDKLARYKKYLDLAEQDRIDVKAQKAASPTVASHVQIRDYLRVIVEIEEELDSLDPIADHLGSLPDEEIIQEIGEIQRSLPDDLVRTIFKELKKRYE